MNPDLIPKLTPLKKITCVASYKSKNFLKLLYLLTELPFFETTKLFLHFPLKPHSPPPCCPCSQSAASDKIALTPSKSIFQEATPRLQEALDIGTGPV